MKAYQDLLRDIMENGIDREDRTGTGTRSVFGRQIRFDLSKGFPLVTTKKVPVKSLMAELVWFLRGSTDNNELRALGSTIWDEWALEDGRLGPIYGKQWRNGVWARNSYDSGGIDQVEQVLWQLKNKPFSRRIIISAWNVGQIPDETKSPQENVMDGVMALAPCHTMFQFYVHEGEKNPTTGSVVGRRKLSCHLFARSIDAFLGLPFNIASYAALVHLFANTVDMDVGELIISFGDLHIYSDHFIQVATLLAREPRPLPSFTLPDGVTVDNVTVEDLVDSLVNYDHHPAIKANVSV